MRQVVLNRNELRSPCSNHWQKGLCPAQSQEAQQHHFGPTKTDGYLLDPFGFLDKANQKPNKTPSIFEGIGCPPIIHRGNKNAPFIWPISRPFFFGVPQTCPVCLMAWQVERRLMALQNQPGPIGEMAVAQKTGIPKWNPGKWNMDQNLRNPSC